MRSPRHLVRAWISYNPSLYKVPEILSNSMDMVRGTITILNPLRDEISIEVAHGRN
jgi:hypothetical protein